MAESTFTFELVSPERLLISKPAAMVSVPGGEGEYSVLPGHIPMITNIKAGVIRVYADDQTTVSESIFVAGGFAEVTPTRFTVLAEEAIPVVELDRHEIHAQYKDIEAKFMAAEEEADREILRQQRDVVEAKLQAVA